MKTKIVLWGSNENDEKLLIAIELLEKENKVKIHTFPAGETTEAFYNQMMNLWRNGGQVIFPENHHVQERPLSLTESLLPDDLKTERTDLINRAKTEWHFVVLSAKLHATYKREIEDFNERIDQLMNFDSGIWEEMKGFWSKVQSQVRDKNLFKEHANELRTQTNDLFSKMKQMKKALDEEFHQYSSQQVDQFMETLEEIEKKIEKGLGLQPIFNELKNIQKRFRDTKFTRADRSKVWKRLDAAFKKVKEKKFGTRSSEKSSLDRVTRRYNGLIAAIEKMKNSIARDKKEMEFQNKKIETTEGQLEMQIRQAKLSMLNERIRSKEEKLKEMMKTKTELEKKIELEKQKAAKRAAAKAEAQQAAPEAPSQQEAKPEEQAEENAGEAAESTNDKEVPEAEHKEETAEAGSENDEAPAADEAKEGGEKKEDTLIEAISTTMGEAIEDVVDTVKAVSEVVGDKVQEMVESVINDEEE